MFSSLTSINHCHLLASSSDELNLLVPFDAGEAEEEGDDSKGEDCVCLRLAGDATEAPGPR